MTILIHVRLAEPFWRVIGERDLELTLTADTTVLGLLSHLGELYPDLKSELRQTPPHVFVGDTEADSEARLKDGARVHLVWPIAGG